MIKNDFSRILMTMNFESPLPYTIDWCRDCRDVRISHGQSTSFLLLASHLFSLFREKSSLPRAFVLSFRGPRGQRAFVGMLRPDISMHAYYTIQIW